jgi:hypothetical protein
VLKSRGAGVVPASLSRGPVSSDSETLVSKEWAQVEVCLGAAVKRMEMFQVTDAATNLVA